MEIERGHKSSNLRPERSAFAVMNEIFTRLVSSNPEMKPDDLVRLPEELLDWDALIAGHWKGGARQLEDTYLIQGSRDDNVFFDDLMQGGWQLLSLIERRIGLQHPLARALCSQLDSCWNASAVRALEQSSIARRLLLALPADFKKDPGLKEGAS